MLDDGVVEPGEDFADPAEVEERRDAEVLAGVLVAGGVGRGTGAALLPDVEVEDEEEVEGTAWPDFDRVALDVGIALPRLGSNEALRPPAATQSSGPEEGQKNRLAPRRDSSLENGRGTSTGPAKGPFSSLGAARKS